MKIKILPSACQDLVNGYWFYEKQSPGLGSYFKDTLFSDIDSLSIFGGIHAVHYQNTFGYYQNCFAVYYKIKNNTVYVHAILDCRKNPAWIRRKLK